MPKDAIDSTSADLENDVRNGERASSSRSDDEEQSRITSQEMDPSSKEAQDLAVKINNEPGPGGVLANVLSKTTSRISIDPGPPPDGGLTAWTQVVMGHFIVFTTWGYITSFGVFQTYYVATLGHPPSDISWVRYFWLKLNERSEATPFPPPAELLPKEKHADLRVTGGLSPDFHALFGGYFLRESHGLRPVQGDISHRLDFAAGRSLHDLLEY